MKYISCITFLGHMLFQHGSRHTTQESFENAPHFVNNQLHITYIAGETGNVVHNPGSDNQHRPGKHLRIKACFQSTVTYSAFNYILKKRAIILPPAFRELVSVVSWSNGKLGAIKFLMPMRTKISLESLK